MKKKSFNTWSLSQLISTRDTRIIKFVFVLFILVCSKMLASETNMQHTKFVSHNTNEYMFGINAETDNNSLYMKVAQNSTDGKQKKITGKVIDNEGNSLPGVSVLVKGTQDGTITDIDGNFSFSITSDAKVLVFSFVGMDAQEIPINNQTKFDITLQESSVGLDEVVVVGYGTQSKRDLTGSISSVKAEDLKGVPAINAIQALQGKASGVTITQQTGAPGAGFAVQIRGVGTLGNSQPLYVIDGIVGAGGSNNINPNDIESIDILKDASAAAIYGSRAANGVVLITTKKGKTGKAKILYNGYVGAQSAWKKLDVLNAQQYAEYSNELQANGGQPLIPALADPTLLKDVTNWQDEILRTGIVQDHNLNVSGGSENARYMFSGGYFNQEGILINTGFERFSLRSNSDFNIGKRIKIGETLQVSSTYTYGVDEGSSQSLVNSIHMPTYIPVHDPSELGGYDGPDVADGMDAKNPVRILMFTDRNNKYINILGNAFLSYEIIDGLEYKFSYSMNYSTGTFYQYTPAYTSGERDINQYSSLNESLYRTNSRTIENTLNYKKVIGKHKFSALAGYTRQWYDSRGFNVSVRDFPTTDVRVIGAALSTQSVGGNASDWALASLLGRVTYSYDGKYLFTSNIRRDGSSRFAQGNKYGVFPSFSAGWRISDESFLKNSSVISDLKLKYGWGKLGMQEIGDYPYQATLTNSIRYVLGGTQAAVPAITELALSNSDISWEKTSQSNIGLDLGLFEDQIVVNAEYFHRETNDMLLQIPVSVSAGFSSNPTVNAGSVLNSGVDFMLTYNKQLGDFNFSINGNISYLIENEVTSLGKRTQPIFGTSSMQRTIVGESIGHFYGYKVDHIYQNQTEIDADNALAVSKGWTAYQTIKTAPGDIRFQDIDSDGHITATDMDIIGNPIPKINYGVNLRANYKNFDISVMFQGVADFEVVNKNRMLMWESMSRSFNTTTAVLDRWTPTNPSTTMPRAIAGDPNANARFSDRWIEDGDYARIKLVTLGYDMPKSFISRISNNTISNVRFYASVNNLLTFTKFSAWDPEFTSNTGFNNMYRGVAESIYPQARTYIIGINLGF